jgi:tRNA threonylcarbamoyl adenosine modification protein YeaZ
VILIVSTAEETLQLILARDGRAEAVYGERCPGRMNEVMAPEAKRLLEGRMDDLTAVACVRGPGSFTGVRMGLAFATGLALARGIPMAGLDYLPLLAAVAPSGKRGALSGTSDPAEAREKASGQAAKHGKEPGQIHVATHSRTARVYHQAFAPADETTLLPRALTPPRDLAVGEARALIAAAAREVPVAVLGSGLRRNPDAFALIPGASLLPLENPTPEALAAAASLACFDGPPVDALYLRGSDAEENLAMIAKGRGLSEQEAHRRLYKFFSATQ